MYGFWMKSFIVSLKKMFFCLKSAKNAFLVYLNNVEMVFCSDPLLVQIVIKKFSNSERSKHSF